MTEKPKSRAVPLHEALEDDYRDPEFARGLLDECLKDDDMGVFLRALRDIARANEMSMSDLARNLNLDRRNLYRALSESGNPTLSTLHTVLDALGLRLSVSLKDAS